DAVIGKQLFRLVFVEVHGPAVAVGAAYCSRSLVGDWRPMTQPVHADAESALRRELYFFTLYRVFEAALLALVLFGPETELFPVPRHALLGQAVAFAYLAAALALLVRSRRGALRHEALLGIGIDIVAALLAVHALPAAGAGIALMLLFNIGAASLL